MIEKIKNIIAVVLNALGILKLRLYLLNRKNHSYIRIINYHRTLEKEADSFVKQLEYYKKNYQNINYDDFIRFKDGNLELNKPGIMITFDDGLKNNYDIAVPLLNKYGFTGYFFVSTGKIGKKEENNEYMNIDELRNLQDQGHIIGCHTYTHHRMSEKDTDELLVKEILTSKKELEQALNKNVDTFCWCGGELDSYTFKAANLIKKYYDYSFMTNNYPVYQNTDNYQLQRTNVEARWALPLVKLQICGIMDDLYKNKRDKVNNITNTKQGDLS